MDEVTGYDPLPDLAKLVEVAVLGDYRHRTAPRTATAVVNLRSRLDFTTTETLEQTLRALLGKEQ